MKNYEYKEIYYNLEEINKLGSEGWRLVATKPNAVNIEGNAILEREIKEKPAKVKTKTIEERKADFRLSLTKYTEYPSIMINEFNRYWTEHGENDRKMRFEKQTSFDVTRRLATWYKNYRKHSELKSKRVNSSW